MSDLKAPTYELMTESLSALVQLFNVHQAQSQTNINSDRDKVLNRAIWRAKLVMSPGSARLASGGV